jgi:hypothetical protein
VVKRLFEFATHCQIFGFSKVDQGQDSLGESLKDTFDTVREKLNLDEPLPEGIKLFMKQLRGEDVEVNEPIPSSKGQEPLNESTAPERAT